LGGVGGLEGNRCSLVGQEKGGSSFGKVVALETFFKKEKGEETSQKSNPILFGENYFILKIWFDIVCLSLLIFFGGGFCLSKISLFQGY